MELLMGLSLFWFGVSAAVIAVIILATLGTRHYWYAGLFILFFAVFQHFTPYSVDAWVLDNKLFIAECVAGYLLIGFGWATLAWMIHLHKVKRKYSVVRSRLLPKFLASVGADSLEPSMYEDFRDFIVKSEGKIVPAGSLALDKAVLAEQVILWPFKILGFFLGDAITFLVDAFVGMFGNFFGNIQRWMFKDFKELDI